MNEYVFFQHNDASGMSYRTARADGTVLGTNYTEGAPAELDPLGGNVGTATPYVISGGGSLQPEIPTLQNLTDWDYLLVNGQKVEFQMDGVTVPYGVLAGLLGGGGGAIITGFSSSTSISGVGIGVSYTAIPGNNGGQNACVNGVCPEGNVVEVGWNPPTLVPIAGSGSPSWDPGRQTRKESNKATQSKGQKKRPKAKYDHERYKKCLKDLLEFELGPDDHLASDLFAGFFGTDKTPFSIILDYSNSIAEMPVDKEGRRSVGYADDDFSRIIYIANDIEGINRIATEIHEIGNKIYARFKTVGLPKPEVSAGLQKKLLKAKLEDDDAGMALEECVFGGRVLADGTVLK